MLPYGRQSIDEDDVKAVTDVLRGEWLTTGPAVERFEKDLSAWTGGHPVVSVTSGTAALHVAYAAAAIETGDEIVTSPLSFVATAAAAVLLGASVRFADIEPETGNLDPAAARAELTRRTRVVAAVDYAGLPADLPALRGVADEAGALLLEDAAHSIGSTLNGRPVGDLADLTTLSFFPTKNLTTAEGGAVVTHDDELFRRARSFRSHGLVRDRARLRSADEGPWHQEVHEFGLNYRLPDVLCALGSSQLRRLGAFKARRAEIHARYDEALRGVPGLLLPGRRVNCDPAWHLYPLRVLDGRRRLLFEHLRSSGVGVQVNYIPVYWHPVFADLGYRRGLCPNAEAYYGQQISLPLFPDLDDADVDNVSELVRLFMTGSG